MNFVSLAAWQSVGQPFAILFCFQWERMLAEYSYSCRLHSATHHRPILPFHHFDCSSSHIARIHRRHASRSPARRHARQPSLTSGYHERAGGEAMRLLPQPTGRPWGYRSTHLLSLPPTDGYGGLPHRTSPARTSKVVVRKVEEMQQAAELNEETPWVAEDARCYQREGDAHPHR